MNQVIGFPAGDFILIILILLAVMTVQEDIRIYIAERLGILNHFVSFIVFHTSA